MKKLNAKFIASAALAAVVAASAAVSAGAADYYTAPSYDPANVVITDRSSASTSDSSTSTTPAANTSDEKEATVPAEDVKAIDGTVKESDIAAIAKSGETATFEQTSGDITYTVTIDGDSVTDAKDIKLGMDITVASDSYAGVEVPAGAIIIAPEQKGDFGMTLEITIPASALKDIDVDLAELYYISDDGEVTLVPGGLSVNDDGSVTIAISHASAYVISDVDLTADVDIDAGLDADDDDDGEITIDEPDDTNETPSQGKDDTSVVSPSSNGSDSNPVTGTTLALGSLAVFAAAAVATSKKRK